MNRIPRLPTLLLFLSACTGSTPDDGLVVPVPTLELEHSGASLTELASEAVVLAPRWLQNDLSLNFIKLNETTQDVLGALIVDLDSPWIIDEVAFTVAHLSPELLEHEDFYPQILVENAEMIYEQDLELAYVELIDEGEPGVDEDYWTMARYRIENEAGETIEQDIPSISMAGPHAAGRSVPPVPRKASSGGSFFGRELSMTAQMTESVR
jgi:hypothetical protein